MRDSDVRRATIAMLRDLHSGDTDTSIVQEMGVWSGSVRIDIAVINGELSGYELKSDRDTLDRLPLQADLYSRVFDRVSLVVGKRHAEKAVASVPAWWGVLLASEKDGAVHLRQKRRGRRNPGQDPYLVAQLLWKDEALSVLETIGSASGWRSKRIKAIHQHLADTIPLSQLLDYVRAALKRRQNWLGQTIPDQGNMPIDAKLHPRF
ncbi:sce7726 family protein [Dongia rigui]|uniref:Sce7726 family protein n=1 Tax=Dongia rigui TaxID=940149 RepID=A0ABU5DZX0_9PROT|nr:sce7726 family protein [Dongia rigui]MDY0872820.1 sce7726 family protein [Dongia rigui]